MTLRRGPVEMHPDGDWFFLRAKRRSPNATGRGVRLVDLFSGCGGMTLGATEAARSMEMAAEVVLAMELRDQIRAVYDANFDSNIRERRGDVRERFDGDVSASLTSSEKATIKEVGDVDLLVGGPPCQGHSNLNNHTRRRDPKNSLYLRMIRAVEVLQPSAVVIENVPDVRHDASGVVAQATKRLDELGYSASELVVAAARIGVPQLRMRHLVVALRDAPPVTNDALKSYEMDDVRNLRWAIEDLADEQPVGLFSSASVLSEENAARARYLLRYGKYDLPNRLRPPCHRDKPSHKYKSMYGRLSWEQPAQTITTGFGSPGQGRYLHPERLRTLTPHEAARLQFFPDWFDFSRATNRTALAECIGNAVPSKVAFCVGQAVLSLATDVSSGRVSRLAG